MTRRIEPTLYQRSTLVRPPRHTQVAGCRWLVIMAKSPEAGRVKTRLGREVGSVTATGFYRAASQAVIRRLSRDSRWQTVVSIAPDVDICRPYWPSPVWRMRQGAGDLGVRMQRIMAQLPPGPVVLMGTDIPAVRPAHIWQAFQLLGDADVVFAPAEDGGFWLAGQRRVPRVIDAFRDAEWSTPQTLAGIRSNLSRFVIADAPTLSDVDSAEELAGVAGWSGRVVLPVI